MKSFLQSDIWAELKGRHGWTPHRIDSVLFLKKSFAFGQKFLYAPEISWSNESRIAKLVTAAREFAGHHKAFCLRLEFLEEWNDTKSNILAGLGLIKAFEEVQPEFRQWLDLTPNEDAILAQMKPKGRYNIRLAQKHSVTVGEETNPQIFYSLAQETARRDGFAIRSPDYYADLIETLQKENAGGLFVARYNKIPLAAAIVSFGSSSLYLHGASSHLHRDVMAPYALHWQIIQEAKRRGGTRYDLLAIAPFSEELGIMNQELGERNNNPNQLSSQAAKQPTKPLQATSYKLQAKFSGITKFKKQFGGRSVHFLGSWDLVINPFVYAGFRILEQLRRR